MDLFINGMVKTKLGKGILHVTAAMDPQKGGVSQAVRTLIAGLSEKGIYNEVVSLEGAVKYPGDDFIIPDTGAGKGPWAYSPKLVPWLVENLHRFDTVIVHGLWLFNGYATIKALSILNKNGHKDESTTFHTRLFVMPHGMLDPYFQKASGRKLKAIRNVAYWKLVERKLVNNADGLLFTCEEERLLARMPFRPYHPRLEKVVGLGVDNPPAFHPGMKTVFGKICPGAATEPYLLFISRIHEKKGVDILISAYAQVLHESSSKASSIPNLVIAGPGLDTDYGLEMQRLVRGNEMLSRRVFFPGMITGDAKWGAFYGCESFVLPSHQENFGIAVVEALACGKPVLISDKVNIWREIEASGGGLVASDDEAGVTKLLARWLSMPGNKKQDMEIAARMAFETYFAASPAIERMIAALVS